jgi:hypothetical protein
VSHRSAADRGTTRQERERREEEPRFLDDPDDPFAPPLPGKAHPPDVMDDVTPTLDDEVRSYHHHPNDAGATEFGFDPEAADAAADLAGDLGSAFLEGATRGEDMGELSLGGEDREDADLPMLLDEDEEPMSEDRPRSMRARPFEAPGALGQQSAREARAQDTREPARRRAK